LSTQHFHKKVESCQNMKMKMAENEGPMTLERNL